MGFGMALGGVASGLAAGSQIAQKNQALALQQLQLKQNKDLREKALGIADRSEKNKEAQGLATAGDKIIAQHLKVITDVVTASRKAGQPPEKTMEAIQPLLDDAKDIATRTGKDPAAIDAQAKALLAIPYVPGESKIGSTMEGIKLKIAKNGMESLSPGEKKIYDDAQRGDPMMRAMAEKILGIPSSDSVSPDAAAPAAASPAPAATPAPQPVPTKEQIDALKLHAKDPAAIAAFERYYGAGSAARYLGQ